MTQVPRPAAHASVASPCINVCQVDAARGWCMGCLRTLEEIADWAQSSDAEKRAVLGRVAARRQALHGPEQR